MKLLMMRDRLDKRKEYDLRDNLSFQRETSGGYGQHKE
jgi:hypothetical protein